MSKTIIVNLYGGPGCGKSTTAAAVFAALKRLDINCELATEYAKDCVWSGGTKVFQDQCYLFGKQHFRLFRLRDEVDVVITDAPLLLSLVYNRIYAKFKTMDPLVLEAFNRFNNLNYVLTRSKTYNPKGRNQTEDEAKRIDSLTMNVLNQYDIPFRNIDYTTAEDTIVADVVRAIENVKWRERLTEQYPWLFTAPNWRRPESEERCPVPLEVGDGWRDLIANLAEKLDTIALTMPLEARKGIYLQQIKEKFGGLRFYLSQGTDPMFNAIQEAEAASYHICEECGATGRRRNGSWLRTLCDKCVVKIGYKESPPDDLEDA